MLQGNPEFMQQLQQMPPEQQQAFLQDFMQSQQPQIDLDAKKYAMASTSPQAANKILGVKSKDNRDDSYKVPNASAGYD